MGAAGVVGFVEVVDGREEVDLGLRGTSFTKELDLSVEDWRGLLDLCGWTPGMPLVEAKRLTTGAPEILPPAL